MNQVRPIYSNVTTYKGLREWRDNSLQSFIHNHQKLNKFHDELMYQVAKLAIEKVESEWGPAPTHFAFFVMGSAARYEQSVWSDQDHGIIYEEESEEASTYFLKLGKELTTGLAIAGYEQCDGKVMASNPLWCKSIQEWKKQIMGWIEEEDWESIRYLLTFFDSKVFVGKEANLLELKQIIFNKVDESPYLLKRMFDNVGRIRKVIGLFGQLFVETRGEQTGKIDLKNAAFFPYVNMIRLLAIKEQISQPSTLERLQYLPSQYQKIKSYETDFVKLLAYRLRFQAGKENYEDVHFLDIRQLTKAEKKELKRMVKNGHNIYKDTKRIIEKGCSRW
ncbi:DUF294 nucleotidyltransferase-like domain-containing protein [Bacillus sp. FJAT-45350]|uniref:DUF294 nucleotidyltransferase-like domain-containing protein n=1 Tax=Bacillus sp. FJAT-45350 TaxID=2011014 RepID=UPI000BB83848|nr:DUF294 nucleotidyltransferase-like domain-containing protein [Bacillus sp. FJAT-45350]